MPTKKLTFQNTEGHELSAHLELPIDAHPIAYAIFAHCFTCNKNFHAVRHISEALTHQGIAVLSFDFTGLGQSEGDFSDTNFSSNVEDLVAAAKALTDAYEAPRLLIGHSLGGAAVIFAGRQIKSVEAVATVGAPSSPAHVSHLIQGDIEKIKNQDAAEVSIGGRTFNVKKQFLEDISSQNMPETVRELKEALLIMHSPQDEIVDINHAAKLYEYAMHPKSFVSLDGADHLLTSEGDSRYAGDVIATWAKRYLPKVAPIQLKTKQQVVVQIGSEGYVSEILAGKHRLRADEPQDVGGNDFGPSPYELLLSGLGACTAMTIRMYADRKGWGLDNVHVHLSHKKDYAKDCQECDDKSKIDVIDRTIKIEGDLDDAQKKRLLEIANKCPVHRTLHSQVEVNTSLTD
ncbi:bifunctional alpha/beta hydrolase/OsmC family protein [Reichenbachiella agariperforans]|uniref:bifunctional alpha/beta hydrolase/OsmC family protein n=1 Tax=Reichenbachiella agariperforans TaxID=156994 RepID=UPI001C090BBB|nr:bifunctional alpha/beta hydrolase/OsmC family protein [Reichenbachiella agariperforans]MBU2914632.1 alpha/beta fold hydrolase [Reichenbachiella agariperforans]